MNYLRTLKEQRLLCRLRNNAKISDATFSGFYLELFQVCGVFLSESDSAMNTFFEVVVRVQIPVLVLYFYHRELSSLLTKYTPVLHGWLSCQG